MSPRAVSSAPPNVYLLPLNDDGSPNIQGSYVTLPPPSDPPYILRFSIQGTSSICRGGILWVNIPDKGEEFVHDKFRQFNLEPRFNKDNTFDFPIRHAGAFAYYITYSPLPEFAIEPTRYASQKRTVNYYIDVSPRLTINGEYLPFDGLTVISCLSKFMGKYPTDWKNHFRGIQARGYNCVHYTPLNRRGSSNSPYSIYDQLEFDPTCFPGGEKDVTDLVKTMEKEYGLLSLVDVVWNHTANNSPWLVDHPDAGYNIESAPHLEAALELDDAIVHYSKCLKSYGKPTDLKTMDDLNTVVEGVRSHCVSAIKLWEFYVCQRDQGADAALKTWQDFDFDALKSMSGEPDVEGLKDMSPPDRAQWFLEHGLEGKDQMGERFRRKVNHIKAALLLYFLYGPYSDDKVDEAREEALALIDEINVHFYREYDEDVEAILTEIRNRVRYTRLDEAGLKLGPITAKSPLVETYFTRLTPPPGSKRDPRTMAVVNNGWVWDANALKDNAGPESKAYLRREVNAWEDCVKLRYGSGPEDSPYLWERMIKYTNLMAKYFQAFRIDNCHSTPIHVASRLLNEARRVRPNLAIIAELFSGSEETDNVFVQRLNINGLIREAMQTSGPQEMSQLVHRLSGRPIGSFETDYIGSPSLMYEIPESAEKHEQFHHIRPSPVHAIFMDCTHDNEPPAQKRDARDTLPNSALVAMCECSTGSVMGYDEIYPAIINLVTGKKSYSSPYSEISDEKDLKSIDSGIGSCKSIFNRIHRHMAQDDYSESFTHQDNGFITVHRVQPVTREGYFCIAHTAYSQSEHGAGDFGPVNLPGTQVELLGAWTLQVDQSPDAKAIADEDPKFWRGLESKVIPISDVKISESPDGSTITVPSTFAPGSVALFKTHLPAIHDAVQSVCPSSDADLDTFMTIDAPEAFKSMSLVELNLFLYRCDAEERDLSGGKDGAYDVPDMGPLVYSGIQGWWSVLEPIVKHNNLGHELCNHLRKGNWPMDYIVSRLEKLVSAHKFEGLSGPLEWLKTRFEVVRKLPSFLHPKYFAMVIETAYHAAVDRNLSLLTESIRNSHGFVKKLVLVSTQMIGVTTNSSLWPDKVVPSMAAGLPHFSSDWARCWGRDIFISLRGLTLCTGRFDVAREHIMAFASVVNHGMIPNLLSAGKLPRYNSRDSVWFFLQAIQDYCNISPEGTDLLKQKVPRRFLPYDDTWFAYDDSRAYSKTSTIAEVIFEILQRHATGLHFREHNAGPDLDRQMSDKGFNIDVEVDWSNGLIFGGNQFNCGTWMDKMGESESAGSKGVPGTPRDGAAVEIIGLLYSALSWVSRLAKAGTFLHSSVKKSDGGEITIADWAGLVRKNFEKCFWVPLHADEDEEYDVDPTYVHRRGIYKDLYRSGKAYEDYQLRPNVQIAMVVAPELFDIDHALHALYVADKKLRGPLGMATLDPSDLHYRPYYNNSEDSSDFATAKGRNYHQGPEWVWPLGFHLRALLHFVLRSVDHRAKVENWSPDVRTAKRTEGFQHLHTRLEGCRNSIESAANPWKGLTELTQKDGALCADSSPTQAWSASCLIDLFYDGKLAIMAEDELHDKKSSPLM